MSDNERIVLGKLEEYRALRAEIITVMSRQSQHMALSSAGTSVLIIASVTTQRPEIAGLSLLLIAAFWSDFLRMSQAIKKLGEYIEACIEPHVPGLAWESTARHIYVKETATKPALERLRVAFTSSYGMFGLIAVAVSMFLLASKYKADATFSLFSACIVTVGTARFCKVAYEASEHPKTRGKILELLQSSIDGTPNKEK